MLRTDIAALPGCEMTWNPKSTIVGVPRVVRPFVQTTRSRFGTTRRRLVVPGRDVVTESITHTGASTR